MFDPGMFDTFDLAVKNRVLHPVTVDAGNSPYTARRFEACYVDCSGAARTVNLPASPQAGWIIGVYDVTGNSVTNNITVGRNGKNINGQASNFVIDVDFGMAWFEYDGTDWLLNLGGVDIIGGAGRTFDITFIMDGVGAAVTTGAKGWIRVPWACTLTGWKMTADLSTTTTIDVWKDSYSNFPPDNADTITNGHEPAISGATKAEDTDISDWTTVTVSAGDFLRINVDANDNAKYLELSITAERS